MSKSRIKRLSRQVTSIDEAIKYIDKLEQAGDKLYAEVAGLSSEHRSIFEAGFDAGALDAEGGVIICKKFKKEMVDKAYADFVSGKQK